MIQKSKKQISENTKEQQSFPPIWRLKLSDIKFEDSANKLLDSESEDSPSLTNKAYASIKRKLLYCEYMPGLMLNEKQLDESNNFGRTPVHESILLLKQEGLINIFPRKGMQATPISSSEVKDCLEMRRIIEQNFIVEGKSLYPKDNLIRLNMEFDDIIYNLSPIEILERDKMFFLYLSCSSNNSTLRLFYKDLLDKSFRASVFLNKKKALNLSSLVKRNHEIIQAILNEDSDIIRQVISKEQNQIILEFVQALMETADL